MRGRDPRIPNPRMFRGSELTRLMSMILMLAVIGMLMYRLRDPDTIRSFDEILGNGPGADAAAADAGPPSAANPPEKSAEKPSAKPVEKPAASPKAPADKPSAKPANTAKPIATAKPDPGVKPDAGKTTPSAVSPADTAKPAAAPSDDEKQTDEDWEQAEAFRDESQRVLDRTLAIQPEEMDAYRRLVHWSEVQSQEEMFARAKKGLRFDDFVHSPGAHRGQLVEVELNAALIRRCPEPPKFASPLYEVWGPTRQSGSFLYCCVSVNLPKGLPIEQHIHERVRFVGYFLKVQAYRPALAKPGDRPEEAPVFIGRMVWLKSPAAPPAREFALSSWWIVGIAAAVAVLVAVWVLFGQSVAGRLPKAASAPAGSASLPPLPDPWDVQNDAAGNNAEWDDEFLSDGPPESDPGRRAGPPDTQRPGPNTLLDPGVLPPENGKKRGGS